MGSLGAVGGEVRRTETEVTDTQLTEARILVWRASVALRHRGVEDPLGYLIAVATEMAEQSREGES